MTQETSTDIFDAAQVIDDLLSDDDGAMLAAMARYRYAIITLFGRQGVVEILRKAVDEAENVDYFSARRSRKEIDPTRPEVNLRVDWRVALANDPELRSRFAAKGDPDKDIKLMTEVKAAVIHQQVCRPMLTQMSDALAPHWKKAKATYAAMRAARPVQPDPAKKERDLTMLICAMFSVRIGTDEGKAPDERICALKLFL
jgi:hypothetical protein